METYIECSFQIERDIMIWNNKRYHGKPVLVKSKEDALLQRHRRWYSQFYSENSPTIFGSRSNQLKYNQFKRILWHRALHGTDCHECDRKLSYTIIQDKLFNIQLAIGSQACHQSQKYFAVCQAGGVSMFYIT